MQQNVYSFALNFGMWPWRAIGVDNVGSCDKKTLLRRFVVYVNVTF